MYDLLQQLAYAQPAIAGQRGNLTSFSFACRLWRNSTDAGEVARVMGVYNERFCSPKWSEKELTRLVETSYKAVSQAGELGKFRYTATKHDPTNTPKPSPKRLKIQVSFATEDDDIPLLMGVLDCSTRLHDGSDRSAKVLKYLAHRGITALTARKSYLGITPHGCSQPIQGGERVGNIPPSLVIPTMGIEGDRCFGGVSRSFRGDVRYMAWGVNRLFVAGDVSADTALIVEGQLDSVLLSQYVPLVATLGSAKNITVREDEHSWLSGKRLLLWGDNDEEGKAFMARWRETFPTATTLHTPPYKDATELFMADRAEFMRFVGDAMGA